MARQESGSRRNPTETGQKPAQVPSTSTRSGSRLTWRISPTIFLYAAVPLIAVPVAAATSGLSISSIVGFFPTAVGALGFSFTRMLLAYLLSLAFSLVYGYFASARRTSERVLIPILDILQSIPILGFFPIAIVVLAGLTPGSPIGLNIASIFLIFTSMAWNMVFGVYESLKTLPSDLREAADSFGVTGLQRIRQVLLPATANRLVYNSVLSWTAGWFFLVEAEIFTTNTSQKLTGIGSFLSNAASPLNGNAFISGLVLLIILIAVLDFVVWRPLGRWAERFRYDQAPSGGGETPPQRDTVPRFRRAADFVSRGVRTGVTRMSTPFVTLAAITVGSRRSKPRPLARSAVNNLVLGAVLVIGWLILITVVVAAYNVFTVPISGYVRNQILTLPLAMGASATRVTLAYLACLSLALPLAILLARRPHASRVGLPLVEVIASFPATALFPVIIFELLPYLTREGAALLMLMTGMIWYLFFNILAGIRSIPPDLEEAARSFGLDRRQYYRRLLLPGIFPALVTGSITAFGGGWNTLIVAEYLKGAGQSFQVLGVGELLDIGYSEPGGLGLMTAALLTLVITVVTINELIWKPLYRKAVDKYRYD